MPSSPIISWQIDGETMDTITDFIFLVSKITVDGDCVVPGLRNSPKHDRSRGWMREQWRTLLQAGAGTPFTQWWRSPQCKGGSALYCIAGMAGRETWGDWLVHMMRGKESWGGSASSYYVTGEAGSLDGMGVGWGTSPALLDCLGVEGNSSPSDWLVWGSFFSSSRAQNCNAI